MSNRCRPICLSFLIVAIMGTTAFGQTVLKDRLRARVVLIIPNGAKPPKNYQERLGSAAIRMENFISDWIAHWGYSVERQEFFERNEDGSVEVTLVRGTLKKVQGRKSIPELHQLAVRGAKAELRIPRKRTVTWWIFYDYPEMEGFRGGGNALYGSAINRYPRGGDGPIDLKADLASPKMLTAQMKGSMHEFGHALGLPHTGPRKELKLGNSLMGPVTDRYRNRTRTRDTKVYLSKSSAAILKSHPLFRNEVPEEPVLPKQLLVKNLKAVENRNGTFTVSGQLDSDLKAHSAIVFDSGKSDFGGDYWAQSYVGELQGEGKFEVTVENPYREGKLYLTFCFNNGIVSADTKSAKMKKSVKVIAYSGKKGKRRFRKERAK